MRTIVFSQIFIFITALYHYWFVSKQIFYYFILCLIINFIFVYKLYQKKYEVDIELHNSKAILYQYINDTISNLVSIYGFNQEENEKNEFKITEYKKYNVYLLKSLNIYFLSSVIWNLICGFIFFGLNYLLYRAHQEKKINIETLISTFTMTFSILGVFENTVLVSNQVSKLFSEIGDIETYFETIKEKNKNIKKPCYNFKNGDIEFKNVYYKYNDNLVLNNINFKIKRGEHVAIVGPIGSGKSTIIKLLMGYNRLTMGKIMIGDKNIETIYEKELRENIYYIPQKPKLFNRTLYKNITYGLKNPPKKENILKLLEQLNLNDLIEPFTKKMDEKVGIDGNNLSGGQKQIVWLLRSFYRDKHIIILDEPTASLDKENKELLIQNIKRLCIGKTLIVISHDNVVQNFRKIHIKEGKIITSLW
jgi:ATP-binding cassette subfamily B protein